MRRLIRMRANACIFYFVAIRLPAEPVLREHFRDHFHGLLGDQLGFLGLYLHQTPFRPRGATKSQLQTSVREMIQSRGALGDSDGMRERGQDDTMTDSNVARTLANCGQQAFRSGAITHFAGAVMLDLPPTTETH